MTGSTTVKVTEIGYNPDPSKKEFEINESGRTYALKVEKGDNEYELYILYENQFYKTRFEYFTVILKYFKSNKIDKLLFVEQIRLGATDNTYTKLSDQSFATAEDALDEQGNLKAGYITEAQFYEASLGNVIAQSEIGAIKRKFNIQ